MLWLFFPDKKNLINFSVCQAEESYIYLSKNISLTHYPITFEVLE